MTRMVGKFAKHRTPHLPSLSFFCTYIWFELPPPMPHLPSKTIVKSVLLQVSKRVMYLALVGGMSHPYNQPFPTETDQFEIIKK